MGVLCRICYKSHNPHSSHHVLKFSSFPQQIHALYKGFISSGRLLKLGQSDYRRIPQDPFIWTFLMEFSILLHDIVI